MSRRVPVSVSAVVIGALLVGCGNSAVRRGSVAPKETSIVSLRSAIVTAPLSTLSCHGGAFCRESILAPDQDDALHEVREDCVHRGGTASAGPCSRSGIAASCVLTGGGAGAVTIVAYARPDENESSDAIGLVSQLCDGVDGTLELAAKGQ